MSPAGPTLVEEWAAANPRSAALHARAQEVLPDGVTMDVRFAEPFSLSVASAKGSTKRDADGHELVCFVMGHGSLLFGHGHEPVVEAVREQAGLALHPGASHEAEAAWAGEVVRLVPSAERVRFTASGTEATLLALRVARAYTGRAHVVKLVSHFHGWHDYLSIGTDAPFDEIPPGVPPELGGVVHALPPDAAALESVLARHPVAAVILEPSGSYSGAVPIPPAFLAEARELTRAHGSLLVFDEMVTGFRWAPGGVQEQSGVVPDLTTLGKILAGGMPGGCVAGSAEVMAALQLGFPGGKVRHTGTHNGHPLAAVAGTVTLRLLGDGAAQAQATAVADAVREGFNEVLRRLGVPGFAYGESSHFCLSLGHSRPDVEEHRLPEVLGVETMKRGLTGPVSHALHAGMLLRGVHLFHGHGFTSTAHTAADIERTVEAFEWTLERMLAEGVVTGEGAAPVPIASAVSTGGDLTARKRDH